MLGDADRRRHHDAQHRSEQELHSWLQQVAAPIDWLLGQLINGFPAQLRALAADPYDNCLMEGSP